MGNSMAACYGRVPIKVHLLMILPSIAWGFGQRADFSITKTESYSYTSLYSTHFFVPLFTTYRAFLQALKKTNYIRHI